MALWSIEIVDAENPGDPPQFIPKLQPGGEQGLLAQAGDSISWDNQSSQVQQPWPTDENFNPLPAGEVGPRGQPNSNYLSDEIPPGHSSRPSWIAFGAAGTVYKYCSRPDPRAHGIITITP
jgi:hypothetical protein